MKRIFSVKHRKGMGTPPLDFLRASCEKFVPPLYKFADDLYYATPHVSFPEVKSSKQYLPVGNGIF